MRRLHLVPELQRQRRSFQRRVPATGEPINSAEAAQQDAPKLLAAPSRGLILQFLEDGTRTIQLWGTDQPSGQRNAGALVVLQADPEAGFEFQAALEQAGGDVGCSGLYGGPLRDRE